MFSYELLNAFCATYEEESYSLAARKISKDRTTVREQVKALEDSYDVRLFDVIGKRVKPTNEAVHLYSHAKHVVCSTEKLNASFNYIHEKEPIELNIYHDTGLSNILALKIEQELTKTYPRLKTNWVHIDRGDALSILQHATCSIAFMPHRNASHLPPKSSDYSHIGYSDLGFYVGRKSKLRHIIDLSLDDLTMERQYVSRDIINLSSDLFVISSQLHVISNNDMLFEMVKYNGWTVTYNELAHPYVQRGELYEIHLKEISNYAKLGLSLFYSLDLKQSAIIEKIKSIAQTHYMTLPSYDG